MVRLDWRIPERILRLWRVSIVRNSGGRRSEIACGANDLVREMMRQFIRLSLLEVTSRNDFMLMEENGEYFVIQNGKLA